MDEKMETQKSHVSCPMSHNWQVAGQDLNPGIGSRAHTPNNYANTSHLKDDKNWYSK